MSIDGFFDSVLTGLNTDYNGRGARLYPSLLAVDGNRSPNGQVDKTQLPSISALLDRRRGVSTSG
jgi:hypothetical protein